MADRPHGRQRNGSGQGSGVYRRGSGTGTGPVGNPGGNTGRPSGPQNDDNRQEGENSRGILSSLLGGLGGSGSSGSSGGSSGGGLSSLLSGKGILIILLIVAVVVIGSCTGLFGKIGNLFGGSGLGGIVNSLLPTNSDTSYVSNLTEAVTSSSGWTRTANTGGNPKTAVASGSRAKYTTIKGGNKDKVTIMVYMCGTDLESKSGMASSDIDEMKKASLSSNIDVIIFTGGCTGWKTSSISNKANQIHKISGGSLVTLESSFSNKSMTESATLTEFIKYCVKNYSANRYELILWDHGGGSLSGYGYDQRFTSSGSMTLSRIDTALKNADVKFDFIGFDTCLMATAENALMLSSYADYLIASEETEPGAGWYYTNWLTKFASNTSMSTLDLGKQIIDDYTDYCASRYQSAKTTLSLVDLAELSNTLPSALKTFAKATTNLINSDSFSSVSEARSSTREYSSSKIDQIDLVHFADNLGTGEAKALSEAVLNAVKYNRVSASMNNSYGLSIYFPYSKLSNVDTAVKSLSAVGVDSEYTKCIKQFASMQTAGQAASGGSSFSVGSLLGSLTGSDSSSSSNSSASSDMISSLLSGFLGGSDRSMPELDGKKDYLSELDVNKAASILEGNLFDASKLVWLEYYDTKVIGLTDDQWKLVSKLELSVYYDDGEGYIDLGLDNIFKFTEKDEYEDEGYLLGEYDGMWLAINGQIVPYYYISSYTEGGKDIDTGRVPVLVNGDRAELLITFVNGKGKVDGVRYITDTSSTPVVGKDADFETVGLNIGDKIDFLCDYYTYGGQYSDTYKFGDEMVYDGKLEVSDKTLPEARRANAVYKFTDIYGQVYWSEVIG
jgi:hypothetical protein